MLRRQRLGRRSPITSRPVATHVVGERARIHSGAGNGPSVSAPASARAAHAPTAREKAYLDAIEQLFGAGDRLSRFRAFATRLSRLSQDFPDDDEARVFQALAWLGSIPEGARQPEVSVRAAALAAAVLERNPRHPGAAHYVLHAYDDGEHNAKALGAARIYARIAPSSSHALHMPSHAFLPLGLWDEAATSDEAAYAASVAWVKRTGRSVAQHDFHALSWLQYAYLQQGRFAKAREVLATVDAALAATDSRPANQARSGGGPGGRADAALPGDASARAMDRRPALSAARSGAAMSTFDNIDELFALGLSSVGLEDYARADAAVKELDLASRALSDKDASDLASLVREQLIGLLAIARGDQQGGLKALASAAQRESSRPKPNARPYPPKPAGELYAEALLGLGNPGAAVDQYRRVLQRTPRRAQALLDLARALDATGRKADATITAREFLEMWKHADRARPELAEAAQLAQPR